MIDFQKLKHEWKTAALAGVTTLVGLHDLIATSGYDLTPFVPEQWRPYVIPLIGVSFLLLRRWTDVPNK
jgi:hypothetical protein